MTWANIEPCHKPITAPTASVGCSGSLVPAHPAVPLGSADRALANVTAGLAAMKINNFQNTHSRAPAVESKVPQTQNKAKKGSNCRSRSRRENKSNNASSKPKVLGVNPAAISVRLEELNLFPKLPTELRLKVYRHAMTQRRIIELEWGPNMDIPTCFGNGSHHWVRVCPRSRQPPTLMHVCQESRAEAEKVYTRRCFDSKVAKYLPNNPELHEHWVWYNPTADIIFFGEDTCVSTYISVFSGKVEDIPAIAILNSNKNEACCDHDDYTYGIDGGVDTLQALHGFDPKPVTIHDYRYGGCPGLKEVFIVVKSKLFPYKQGEIDASATLRPATSEGLTKGQARFKARLGREIANVEAGVPLAGVGENIWTHGKAPIFKFVSLAKVLWGADPREPEGMAVSRKDLFKLQRGDWGFIKRTEATTGCEIFIPEEEYRGEDPREIGFRGMRTAIDAAKYAIEERLAS